MYIQCIKCSLMQNILAHGQILLLLNAKNEKFLCFSRHKPFQCNITFVYLSIYYTPFMFVYHHQEKKRRNGRNCWRQWSHREIAKLYVDNARFPFISSIYSGSSLWCYRSATIFITNLSSIQHREQSQRFVPFVIDYFYLFALFRLFAHSIDLLERKI